MNDLEREPVMSYAEKTKLRVQIPDTERIPAGLSSPRTRSLEQEVN